MSNLSELIPAGSGAKVAEFVASGTLASGQTVVLRSDGKVEAVSGVAQTVGSAAVFQSADSAYINLAFDSANNKIVVAYQTSTAGYAVVGTVSGTSISFGTPVVFASGSPGIYWQNVVFDSNANKFVFAYYGNGPGKVRVGTVSGTSISFGTEAQFNNQYVSYIALVFDSNANKVVIAYRDQSNSSFGTALVATVSGTSISFGSKTIFESANSEFIAATFDSNANKIVISYTDGNLSNYGTAIVGTVSGTSISFGTAVVFSAANSNYTAATFDSNANKIVIAYRDVGNSEYGTAIVGTVSGTSISFGTAVVFNNASSTHIGTTFDPVNKKVAIVYSDSGNSSSGTVITGTVSGTSISFDSALVYSAGTTSYNSATFDSNANKVVIAFRNTSNYGASRVLTVGSSNNTDFVGITNAAISNSATGEVVPQGGVITNGSLLLQEASSTFGSESVYENSESAYEAAVYDTANNKVVVAYKDTADSQKGKAVVGTVSGTSISFGTPVNFEGSDTVTYVKAAYDPDQGKVIITWNSNSTGHHKAIVGTVSGTTMSFGSPVTYEASAGSNFGIVYDTSNDKAVLTFKDGSNSNYGTAIVGTVSGTSISFGTKAVIKSQNLFQVGSVFDSTNNKVLISYTQDLGGASSDTSELVVGTVSGTNISFGTALQFLAGQAFNQSLSHDTSSGKNVLVYRDINNSSYGTAVVATISGTSVSIGTSVVFSAATTQAITAMYDPTTNATFVFYKDGANSDYGTAKGGVISGTDISFGSASIFNAANPGGILSAVKDPDQNKAIVAYTDYGNNQYGTAVVGTLTKASPALTIGTDYYVQNDGTLSTTTSTVPAGRALSATSILLEG